jgi:hypothetical protein
MRKTEARYEIILYWSEEMRLTSQKSPSLPAAQQMATRITPHSRPSMSSSMNGSKPHAS